MLVHQFVVVCVLVVVEEEEESGSDADSEGPKLRSSGPMSSNPVPLGWPKVCWSLYWMTVIH